jgi:LDH2 family malate/lactate/ureidoglycolate dehydrogenase
MSSQVRVQADLLARAVAAIFRAAGIPAEGAEKIAEDLVAADLEGVGSHGVMLVPMYVERIRAGSVSALLAGVVASDRQAAVVIDAQNAFGQLTARQAVELAAERASQFGLAAVAVRNAFHFGTAGRYARMLADRGCVGIVMSNTRPLMPPPGGAEPVTGNNPIAIAVPGDGDFPPEVDMALSAVAMGKIRNAAAAGATIPAGWATDRHGAETTDPAEAIAGMLLPAAGPKGFGLAFMIDLLCGGLSGGVGDEVRPLFGSLDRPYNCAHLFIAIHAGSFTDADAFRARARQAAQKVSGVLRAPGVDRVFAPGELADHTRRKAMGTCLVPRAAFDGLVDTARTLGIDLTPSLTEQDRT